MWLLSSSIRLHARPSTGECDTPLIIFKDSEPILTPKWQWVIYALKITSEQVFDFLRLNILGRVTGNNIPQFEVGCPPAPHIKEVECKDSTALSSFFFEHGYVTGKSATHVVRVNHHSYEPEDNIDRHEDHSFLVQCTIKVHQVWLNS